MHPLRVARHYGRLAIRRAFPTPEEAAWRRLLERAERFPEIGRHEERLLDLVVRFPDAGAVASQWHDIFVRNALCLSLATEAPRVIDCGAHIGLATLWIKRRWPRARVTAFEADPEIAETLAINLTRNKAHDVEVVPAAVWTHTGTVRFRSTGTDAGALDAVAADTGGSPGEVRSERLRDWLTEPIDLLKVDIEGAELDVLMDSADRLHLVRNIHLEVHDFDPTRRLLPRSLLTLEQAGFAYALGDVSHPMWRAGVGAAGPFPTAVPSWIAVIRAWRTE